MKALNRYAILSCAAIALSGLAASWSLPALADALGAAPIYTMQEVGWIRKSARTTFIEIDKRY